MPRRVSKTIVRLPCPLRSLKSAATPYFLPMWAPSLVSLLLLLSGCDTSGSAGVPPAQPTLPLLVHKEVAGETPALPGTSRRAH